MTVSRTQACRVRTMFSAMQRSCESCWPVQIVDLEEVIMPGNARLLYHDNECYDWGTLGWIMSAGIVDIQDYKYFIMINSSVRGPYAPPYQPVRLLLYSCAAALTRQQSEIHVFCILAKCHLMRIRPLWSTMCSASVSQAFIDQL